MMLPALKSVTGAARAIRLLYINNMDSKQTEAIVAMKILVLDRE